MSFTTGVEFINLDVSAYASTSPDLLAAKLNGIQDINQVSIAEAWSITMASYSMGLTGFQFTHSSTYNSR